MDDRRVGFLRQSAILFLAVSAANVANYLFHLSMTRLLGPGEYGALGALAALLLVLAVPTGAAQVVIARRATIASGDAPALHSLLKGTLRYATIVGGGFAFTLAALAPFLKGFFHVTSVVPMLLLALYVFPATVSPVGRAVLQGTFRLRLLGLSVALGTAVKLVLGVVFVRAGYGLTGAMGAVVLGEVAGAAVAFAPFARQIAKRAPRLDPVAILREASRAAIAITSYFLLVSVDLILVRHYHPGEVSGRYAAATLLGRAVLFLPGAITMAVYPRFAERPAAPETRRLLIRSAGIVVGLSSAATLGVFAFPNLVQTLFGRSYSGRGAVGQVLALAMICYGLVGLLMHYRLATGRAPVKTLGTAVAIQIAGIVAVHDSPMAVATMVLATGALLVVVMLTQTLRRVRQIDIASEELSQAPSSDLELTVVTPSFNGAPHIRANLARLDAALRSQGINAEVILVSDGSTDGTSEIALDGAGDGLRVISYEQNQGKGFALRTGLARARGTFVAFIDSDGDLDPGDLPRFLQLMRLYQADLVVGSKRHPLSSVAYPWPRRMMSWSYQMLVRVLFGIKVRDTQTGIKLIRRDLLADVLPRLVEKRFAFDLELLVAARRLGYHRILEAPVSLDYQFSSTVSPRAVRGILQDTAAIWYRRYVLHWYDRPVPSQQTTSVLSSVGAE